MNHIGPKLKMLRKTRKYSTKVVTQKLRDVGFEISDKTLYGYENGVNMPNADIFIELCKIYECRNVLEVFSETDVDYSIPNESAMIATQKYNAQEPLGDGAAEALNLYVKLDETDQARITERMTVLLEDEKYSSQSKKGAALA